MYQPHNLSARKKLKSHPAVRAEIGKFWKVLDMIKDANGALTKKAYMSLNVKLQKCMVSDFDVREAREDAEMDWRHDTSGSDGQACREDTTTRMTEHEFFSSMFELADHWTDGISVEEYLDFYECVLSSIVSNFGDGEDAWKWKDDDDIEANHVFTLSAAERKASMSHARDARKASAERAAVRDAMKAEAIKAAAAATNSELREGAAVGKHRRVSIFGNSDMTPAEHAAAEAEAAALAAGLSPEEARLAGLAAAARVQAETAALAAGLSPEEAHVAGLAAAAAAVAEAEALAAGLSPKEAARAAKVASASARAEAAALAAGMTVEEAKAAGAAAAALEKAQLEVAGEAFAAGLSPRAAKRAAAQRAVDAAYQAAYDAAIAAGHSPEEAAAAAEAAAGVLRKQLAAVAEAEDYLRGWAPGGARTGFGSCDNSRHASVIASEAAAAAEAAAEEERAAIAAKAVEAARAEAYLLRWSAKAVAFRGEDAAKMITFRAGRSMEAATLGSAASGGCGGGARGATASFVSPVKPGKRHPHRVDRDSRISSSPGAVGLAVNRTGLRDGLRDEGGVLSSRLPSDDRTRSSPGGLQTRFPSLVNAHLRALDVDGASGPVRPVMPPASPPEGSHRGLQSSRGGGLSSPLRSRSGSAVEFLRSLPSQRLGSSSGIDNSEKGNGRAKIGALSKWESPQRKRVPELMIDQRGAGERLRPCQDILVGSGSANGSVGVNLALAKGK